MKCDNLVLCLSGCGGQKGRRPHQHLVQDDAHGPPVAELRVARALQHLGGDVVGCAHQRVSQAALVLPAAPALQRLKLATPALSFSPLSVRLH